jgi:hypothetical protein
LRKLKRKRGREEERKRGREEEKGSVFSYLLGSQAYSAPILTTEILL